MSTTNNALLSQLYSMKWTLYDNMTAGPASSQSLAAAISGQCCRCTVAVANGSLVLGDLLTNNTPATNIVINDSGQTILVFAFPGNKMNGTLNSSLSIATGDFAFFSKVQANLDWRSAVVS